MILIDGFTISNEIRNNIKEQINKLKTKPCLAVIIVGNNQASQIYVKNKEKACKECGIESLIIRLDDNISEKELINEIIGLNKNKNVDGILVQCPLPKHINFENIINYIDCNKDVDCFNPINIGKFFTGSCTFVTPCTPTGCMYLIKSVCKDLSGKKAVVIGRSNIVGKPMAQMLLNENCTITIAHSKTKNIEELTKSADIIVVAIGKSKFLKSNMTKNDAIIIDVGINRMEDGKICGDVDFDDFKNTNCYITPVPKGVGPMTITYLLENTLKCYKRNRNE